jgi:hypothetical protein
MNRRDVIAASAASALAAGATSAEAQSGAAPQLEHVFDVSVRVATPINLGESDGYRRRTIPILDGTVTGPRFIGTVLPGGADWQRVRVSDGLTRLVATYAIQHEDGTIVQIENAGIRRAAPEVMARLNAGQPVDPALVYFRTIPSFDAPAGPHAWLNDSIFIASGRRAPDSVQIAFFRVL